MFLVCSSRCGGKLFRALFAEVEIDASGEYQDHRLSQPGYVCLNCGAPAVVLGEVPAELAAVARADERDHAAPAVLRPRCGTLVQLGGDTGCPNGSSPRGATRRK